MNILILGETVYAVTNLKDALKVMRAVDKANKSISASISEPANAHVHYKKQLTAINSVKRFRVGTYIYASGRIEPDDSDLRKAINNAVKYTDVLEWVNLYTNITQI